MLVEGADRYCFLVLLVNIVLPVHFGPLNGILFSPVLQLSLRSFQSSSSLTFTLNVLLSSFNMYSCIVGCDDSLGINKLLLGLLCTRIT